MRSLKEPLQEDAFRVAGGIQIYLEGETACNEFSDMLYHAEIREDSAYRAHQRLETTLVPRVEYELRMSLEIRRWGI